MGFEFLPLVTDETRQYLTETFEAVRGKAVPVNGGEPRMVETDDDFSYVLGASLLEASQAGAMGTDGLFVGQCNVIRRKMGIDCTL